MFLLKPKKKRTQFVLPESLSDEQRPDPTKAMSDDERPYGEREEWKDVVPIVQVRVLASESENRMCLLNLA
jgi:hypothetical protein